MDEKLGRIYSKHANLTITGTTGVLKRAKNQGLIPKLKPLLSELKSKDVWFSDKLAREVLGRLGES